MSSEVCKRCKGSAIDPELSHSGIYGGWYWEPPALEPCIDCQWVPPSTCHCGAVNYGNCNPDACGWTGPEDCAWGHGHKCYGLPTS